MVTLYEIIVPHLPVRRYVVNGFLIKPVAPGFQHHSVSFSVFIDAGITIGKPRRLYVNVDKDRIAKAIDRNGK